MTPEVHLRHTESTSRWHGDRCAYVTVHVRSPVRAPHFGSGRVAGWALRAAGRAADKRLVRFCHRASTCACGRSSLTGLQHMHGRRSAVTKLTAWKAGAGSWLGQSFLRLRNPSPPSSPAYVMATLALAGSARKSMRVRPVTFPAGCRPTASGGAGWGGVGLYRQVQGQHHGQSLVALSFSQGTRPRTLVRAQFV